MEGDRLREFEGLGRHGGRLITHSLPLSFSPTPLLCLYLRLQGNINSVKGSWTEVRKGKLEVGKVKRRRVERESNMGKGGLIRSSRPTPSPLKLPNHKERPLEVRVSVGGEMLHNFKVPPGSHHYQAYTV